MYFNAHYNKDDHLSTLIICYRTDNLIVRLALGSRGREDDSRMEGPRFDSAVRRKSLPKLWMDAVG